MNSVNRASATVRVLIAEDDPEMRALLRAQVQTVPGFEVVGLALDEQRAVGLCHELAPEVVVIGVDDEQPVAVAVAEVKNNCPQVKVLVVTPASGSNGETDGADVVLSRPIGTDTFVTSLLELVDAD